MQQDNLIRIFLDIETEDLSAKTLLQLSAISENNICFNAYVNPNKELSYHCYRFTKLHFQKGALYKDTEKVYAINIKIALQQFKDWVENLKVDISLVAFNGIGFDFLALTRLFREQNIQFPLCVKQFEDPLPCFKKYFKNKKVIDNFRLGTLANVFQVDLSDAHNAIEDSRCLKQICEKFCEEQKLTLSEFLKPYVRKPERYLNVEGKCKK